MARMKKVLTFPSCFFLSVVAPLYLEELDYFTPRDTILLIQDLDGVLGVRQVSLERCHFKQHDIHKVLSNISLVAAHGRYRELQLRRVAGPVCKPQSHTSRGWEMVRSSKVLTFLSFQISSRLSLVRPSSTYGHLL
jgi:hypothetical protein